MELEEMKTLWGEMSQEIEKQKKLTSSLIIKMTQATYRNKINNILLPETIGSFACFAESLFILINFQKLNSWYLQVCGIAAVLVLIVLGLLSARAVFKIRSVNITDNNYKQSLEEYSKSKIQFVFVQKLNFYLGAILLVTILPVMVKLIDEIDFFKANGLWLWYPISFPFFYFITRWVFKRYMKSATDAVNILKELNDN